MANQLIIPRALDANGDPASGAKANVYETGTTTPVTVYTDTGLSLAHANPIVADSAGYFAQAFYGGSIALKVVVTDSADATLVTYDPVPLVSLSASAATDVTFSPTTEIPSTDVQAAIVAVEAAIPTTSTFGESLIDDADAATARTTLGLGSAAVATLLDEDNMASDDATAAPSQQSVKAYVDNFGLPAPDFDGTESTLAASTTFTFAHGLAAIPTKFDAVIRCATASNGFSVNDTLLVGPYQDSTTNGVGIWADSTNVYVRTAGAYAVFGPSGYAALTVANFQIKARAWA